MCHKHIESKIIDYIEKGMKGKGNFNCRWLQQKRKQAFIVYTTQTFKSGRWKIENYVEIMLYLHVQLLL